MMVRKIKRSDYESCVLQTLKETLGKGQELQHRGNSIRIEDVLLDESGRTHRIHILFREETRLECLFGFSMEAVENTVGPSADPIVLSPLKGYWGPEEWANIVIATHFEDQIEDIDLGLPAHCDPEVVNWIT